MVYLNANSYAGAKQSIKSGVNCFLRHGEAAGPRKGMSATELWPFTRIRVEFCPYNFAIVMSELDNQGSLGTSLPSLVMM